MRRLAKKGRAFDAIVLDPPTFSQSKERGAFRVEKNYGELVAAALPLLKPDGVLLASTNAADWPPEKFLDAVEGAVRAAKRKIAETTLRAATAGFSGFASGAGVFENGLAKSGVTRIGRGRPVNFFPDPATV